MADGSVSLLFKSRKPFLTNKIKLVVQSTKLTFRLLCFRSTGCTTIQMAGEVTAVAAAAATTSTTGIATVTMATPIPIYIRTAWTGTTL